MVPRTALRLAAFMSSRSLSCCSAAKLLLPSSVPELELLLGWSAKEVKALRVLATACWDAWQLDCRPEKLARRLSDYLS